MNSVLRDPLRFPEFGGDKALYSRTAFYLVS